MKSRLLGIGFLLLSLLAIAAKPLSSLPNSQADAKKIIDFISGTSLEIVSVVALENGSVEIKGKLISGTTILLIKADGEMDMTKNEFSKQRFARFKSDRAIDYVKSLGYDFE